MAKLTQDEKDAIRDAGVAQWWEDWFEADYSWEGLTKYPWQDWMVVEDKAAYDAYIKAHGLPEGCPNRACQVIPNDYDGLPNGTQTSDATLQDYWRDQEELLIAKGQKTYTIAHLPVHYEDGEESWKFDPDHKNWEALSDLIEERLARGVRTDLNLPHSRSQVSGQDGRANFQGCVLPALPLTIHPAKTDTGDSTPSDVGADEARPNKDGALHLSLRQAAIMQPQSFRGTIFGSTANFYRTLFAGSYTSFSQAQFSGGDASFLRAQFVGGDAYFNGAQFSGGDASFVSVQFSGGDAYFRNAQFSGGGASFGRAQFSGGDAFFIGAQFSCGEASFSDALFSGGDAFFIGAQFSGGNAFFRNAQFSGGEVGFGSAQFSGGVGNFYNAQFSGGDASFSEAEFKKSVHFKNAQFGKAVNFENTEFPPSGGSHDAFRGTQFLGPATFNRTKFKDDDGSHLPPSQLHFPFNAFGLAYFKDQVILTQRGDRAAQTEFDQALASTAEACHGADNEFIEAQYVALESGCTTLKRAMESVSDKNRAQRYFKFELLARQRRPSTPWLVKQFTRFYGWTADYGGSISRPLVTLLFLGLFCSVFYGLNASWVQMREPWPIMISGAADFSLTQIFRPLFIWSKSVAVDDGSWLSEYKIRHTAFGWLAIKLVATAQSFLSLTLIFLFGLATKRKFQIS